MITSSATRTERDTFGPINVPADRLWGAQTQRSLQNFDISGERQPTELIRALAQIKRSSALVNHALGLQDEIPIASLAKRFEEVFIPGRSTPVEVPRGSDALFMLQRLRDEAHRFANTFHRELRGKRMTSSSLDGIAGLGEARQKKLVQVMGGVNAVKKASLDDLQALSFLPAAVAQAVHAKFHAPPHA